MDEKKLRSENDRLRNLNRKAVDDIGRRDAENVELRMQLTAARTTIAKEIAARDEVAEFARRIGQDRDDWMRRANKAEAELARLTTPRPIEEAPRDGKVRGLWLEPDGTVEREEIVHIRDGYLRDWHDEPFHCPVMGDPTHFLPLPEVKP